MENNFNNLPDHSLLIEWVDYSQYKALISKARRIYSKSVRRGKIDLALRIKKKYHLKEYFDDSCMAFALAIHFAKNKK